MNTNASDRTKGRWKRPTGLRAHPLRNAGGFYRTAEANDGTAGGIPLTTANAAIAAAVRLAYEVAENQIERSTRMARRLREAGDREVGERSDEKLADATERLVMKTLLSGLEWWEGSVAEGRCPVKRLAAAEYQMLGTVLGFEAPQRSRKVPPAAPAPAPASARSPAPPSEPPGPRIRAAGGAGTLQVVHKGLPEYRRRVTVEAWDLTMNSALHEKVYFQHANGKVKPLLADVSVDTGNTLHLQIETMKDTIAGRWTCAICDSHGVQVGYIEISL